METISELEFRSKDLEQLSEMNVSVGTMKEHVLVYLDVEFAHQKIILKVDIRLAILIEIIFALTQLARSNA